MKRTNDTSNTMVATVALAVAGVTMMVTTLSPSFAKAEASAGSVLIVSEAEDGHKFLRKSAMGSMLEIKLGELAKTKGHYEDVKAFGAEMVTDHTKALSDIRALASQKGITLPTEEDDKTKAEVAKFSALSGEKFDKAYIKAMVEDHQQDIAETKEAKDHVDDKDVRQLASKLKDVYEKHLEHAKKIRKELKD